MRLSTEDLEALLDGLLHAGRLGASGRGRLSEGQHGDEGPFEGDAPLGGDLGVDEGVIVLEAGTCYTKRENG